MLDELLINLWVAMLMCIAEATPKTIMRTMGVKGLTLYHLKSHLQVCCYHIISIEHDLPTFFLLFIGTMIQMKGEGDS